ncbi:MAG: PAS domain S-box protein [Candidatus Marinimicrobia bacterium]|nr:PAS domain S-box protein [Candidatus Neomarinimicrobiota bacterium]
MRYAKCSATRAEELTRKKWQEITPENDIPRTQKVIDALVSGKKDTARYTKVFIHKHGSPVWVDVSIALIRDEKGDPDYFITTDIDISKRIEAMRSLSASEERYRTFINATEDMTFLKDKDFRYLFINDANAAFFGESPEDILGKDDFSLMPEQAAQDCRKSDQKALRYGRLYTQEEKVRDRIYESRKFPVLLQDGTTGVGGIVRDITEKYYTEAQIKAQNKELLELNRKLKSSLNHVYQTTRELKLAKEKAEESDRLKSAFLANMSHEIRTPMNGILGFVDLLQKAGLNEKQEKLYLDMVEKSGKRLLNTINDIIEISKIEADEVRLQFAPVNVDDMIRYLYEFFRPQAEAKGLYLRVKKDPEKLPFHLLSDRYKLEAVLMNFIRNAIKFTEKGGLAFGYAFSGGELDLWVKDSGIGISRERLDAVFERFVQADLTKSSPYEGSGLGLSIAKAYADMLGGRLHVGSEPGKGSTFGIVLTVNNKNTIKQNGDDDEQGNNKTKP